MKPICIFMAVTPLLAGCNGNRTIRGEQARIVVEHRLGASLPLGVVVQECHVQTYRDSFLFAKLSCTQQALDELIAAIPQAEETGQGKDVVPPIKAVPWFSMPRESVAKTLRRDGRNWFVMHVGKLAGGRRTVLLSSVGNVP